MALLAPRIAQWVPFLENTSHLTTNRTYSNPDVEHFRQVLWRALAGSTHERNAELLLGELPYFLDPGHQQRAFRNIWNTVPPEDALFALVVVSIKALISVLPLLHVPAMVEPTLRMVQEHMRRVSRWLPSLKLRFGRPIHLWPYRQALEHVQELRAHVRSKNSWAVLLSPSLERLARNLGYAYYLDVAPSHASLAWQRPLQFSSMQVELSYEHMREAFEDVAGVLWELNQDFFPVAGTLIALLRYGSMIGVLSDGKQDVVDRDIDFLVRVEGPRHWLETAANITRLLMARGWNGCRLRYGHDFPVFAGFSPELKCRRWNKYFAIADFAPYMVGRSEALIFQSRICRNETLWPPVRGRARRRDERRIRSRLTQGPCRGCAQPPEQPLQCGSGPGRPSCGCAYTPAYIARALLPRRLVYPLRRCAAYDSSVPCPSDSIGLIKAVAKSDYGCVAYPVITGDRNPWDARNIRLLQEGLSEEDFQIIRSSAEALHRQGYRSFRAELRNCRPVLAVSDVDKWHHMKRVNAREEFKDSILLPGQSNHSLGAGVEQI